MYCFHGEYFFVLPRLPGRGFFKVKIEMTESRSQYYERMIYQYGLHSLLIALELHEEAEKYQECHEIKTAIERNGAELEYSYPTRLEQTNFRKLSNYNKTKARFNAVLIFKNS